MLLQFSVQNYKTFKEKVSLAMYPSGLSDTEQSVFEVPKFNQRLLKSAVMYGANASGKTKLVEAMVFMRKFVHSSANDSQKGDPIGTDAFRLDNRTIGQPSEFELTFIHKGVRYRYGFVADRKRVHTEWLYYREATKEVEYFLRIGQVFEAHKSFKIGSVIQSNKLMRENALLLSHAAQLNDTKAGKVLEWFENFNVISGNSQIGYEPYTVSQLKDSEEKKRILDFVKKADLGIEDISIEKAVVPMAILHTIRKDNPDAEFYRLRTKHTIFNAYKQREGFAEFDMEEDESAGTQKYFALAGPILTTLLKGEILVVDELDSKLHPNLVEKIVSLFHNKETNPHNAQLIFNTHNTNLLNSKLFRRDQVWFVEKDRYGAAKLFALSEFKGIRKDDKFEERYLEGRYGGVPYLGYFDLANTFQLQD